MLKKAGMVVLGATAGMLSLAPLANAGEATQHDGGHGQHGEHGEHHDGGHGHGRGDCGDVAFSQGDRLLSLDNIASNASISHVNVLAQDNSRGGGCDDGDRGGRGGHGHGHGRGEGGGDVAFSQGNRLISADNLLANADVSHVNVLATDNSR
jgi:hypothetical protein